MEKYKFYASVTIGNVTRTKKFVNITPSKKAEGIRKAFFHGYKVVSEGSSFIALQKEVNGMIKKASFFTMD
jgi:hypothetical protein